MNVEMLIAPHVRGMQPYVPIVPLDVLSRRLGLPADRIVKLDANENPYGTSPRALEALAHSRELHIYPDPDQTALREALAAFIGVPMEHILCGAGGDEVIDLLARAFVEPGQYVIDLPPTFGMYKWEADVLGAGYIPVARRPDFSVDMDAVEGTVRALEASGAPPKLLFVTNPNNPFQFFETGDGGIVRSSGEMVDRSSWCAGRNLSANSAHSEDAQRGAVHLAAEHE